MTEKRRIAVLEILALPGKNLLGALVARQYAAVFPQAIAVWCAQAGHEVTYRTYCGRGDLPDLGKPDVLFVSCTSECSALAYLVAKGMSARRPRATRTVIGGPHARCYPEDCARFFDVVVDGPCDRDAVLRLAAGDLGYCRETAAAPCELPTVQERSPYIRQAALIAGRWPAFPVVGMLSSLGCGGGCAFCTDCSNPWQPLPMERLEQDLRFIRDKLRWPVLFHDPNMGQHLDDVLDVMERIGWRTPWAFEADLNALTEKKLQRLSKVNCRGVGIGIESWTAYGHKTGTAAKTPAEKYAAVCQRLVVVRKYIPGIAANMIWPSDTDHGPQPLELTAGLMGDCPFLWTPINTPVAFGGTPMYAKMKREGRVLPLPFAFQAAGYLNIVPKHYGPAETLRGFIDLVEGASQWGRWRRRTRGQPWRVKLGDLLYKSGASQRARRVLAGMAKYPRDMLRFHAGLDEKVPQWYWQEQERLLGRLAGKLTRAELTPVLPAVRHGDAGQRLHVRQTTATVG